jgi:hypothetical protein
MTRTIRLALVAVAVVTLSGTVPVPPGVAVDTALAADPVFPQQCLFVSANHGACVNCCKMLSDLPTSVCSRYCRISIPPPPGGEPQP